MSKKLWFKAKNYGWGWYPATWQGWTVLAVYFLVVILDFIWRSKNTNFESTALMNFMPETFLFTAILIAICWKTGEKPTWRWGNKK